jgi:hypothetical protein
MKMKSLIIMGMILLSLLPLYLLYKFLQVKTQPRQSLSRFFLYMVALFFIIFVYTFLLVYLIKTIFPDA